MKLKTVLNVAAASACVVAGLLAGGQALRSAPAVSVKAVLASCTGSDVVLAHADGTVTVESPAGDSCAGQAFLGSLAGKHLNAPIVGMASTPGGGGYWLVAADGGVFSFGNAAFLGSMGGTALNAPIVGMASTRDGQGYWLVGSDGGVFSFGDARYGGSTGGLRLNKPVVGIAADGASGGYWLVASDGGVFSFNAPFLGSEGSTVLNAPIRFLTGTPDFGGYRMVGADGGVFDFGDAQFYGSAANAGLTSWQALAATPDGGGYWLFSNASSAYAVSVASFGDASGTLSATAGDSSPAPIVGAAISYETAVAPSVTAQPAPQTVAAGGTATFTAAATGIPTPSVQWQVSVNQGTSFVNIANATSTTLTFTAVQSESNGLYRAVFTNVAGSVSTTAASLTVGNAPSVTTQPTSQTVNVGATVTFTAAATGTPAPTVQWEVSSNQGSTFIAVDGGTAPTLTFTATTAQSGNQYRAAFTNATSTVLTAVATLTVIPTGDVIPSSAGGYFLGASCGTSQDCVAVGGTSGATALIESSVNGGSTFSTVPVPSVAPVLHNVDCNDALHCVAVGTDSILESINGGASWVVGALPVETPPPPPPNGGTVSIANDLNGVACQSDTVCTAVGIAEVAITGFGGSNSPEYIHSTDGGLTWSNSTGVNDEMGMVTCNANACIAAGESLTRSTDGGATWQIVTFGNQGLTDVSCTTGASSCLTIGPTPAGQETPTLPGQLGISTDDGQSWTDEAPTLPASTASIQRLACGGATDCMIVGPSPSVTNGTLVVTTANSGASWTLHTGPSGFKSPNVFALGFPAIACTGPTACVIVGDGTSGPVASTTNDGGQTWLSSSVQ